MNKYVLKATALAIGALVGGSAAAAVTPQVTLGTASTAKTFAKELAYGDANPVAHATFLNFTTKLGFGVASATTRYIRVELGNAKFNAAVANVIGTDIDVGTLTAGQSNVAISAGGAAGDTFVIFAVAVSGTDVAQAASADVNVKIPSLRFQGSASDVTVTYSLHETGTSAVAGSSGNAKLAEKSGTLAKFATSVQFSSPAQGSAEASVEDSFKKFKAGADVSGASNQTVRLGTVTVAANADNLKHDGSSVALTDLFDAATKVTVTGDLSVPAGADDTAKKASVFLNGDGTCTSNAPVVAAAVPNATGASFTTGTAAKTAVAICYVTNGTSAIPAVDPYKVKLEVTPKTGTTTAGVGDINFGKVTRDGTELTAPFGSVNANHTTRLVLSSSHTASAKVSITPILSSGSTCTAPAVALTDAELTIPANGLLHIPVKSVCTATTDGKLGLKLNIAAPKSKIEGVLQQYRNADTSTGGISADHSAYPLARPAE